MIGVGERGGSAAVGCSSQRPADLVHLRRSELRDRFDQQGFGHGAQVVEANCTLHRHPVLAPQLNFALEPAHRSRHQRDDDVSQASDRLISSQDAHRPAPLFRQLQPADLAPDYQGSSRIASRALFSAQRSSRVSSSSAGSFDSSSKKPANSIWASITRNAASACTSLRRGARSSSFSFAVTDPILPRLFGSNPLSRAFA